MVAVFEEGGRDKRRDSRKHKFLAEKFYPRKVANNVAEATCAKPAQAPA
jgi:hypothetical protein